MNTSSTPPPAYVDVATWLDVSSRDALELITSSVLEMVGFQVATISVVRGDRLVTVSVEGSEEARSTLLGLVTPTALIKRTPGTRSTP